MNKLLIIIWMFLSLLVVKESNAQCNSDFTYSQNFCQDDSVQFSFSGTGSVSWNFGDVLSGLGNTSNDSIVLHSFTDTGYFTVQCVAISGSCRDTTEKQIYIAEKVDAQFLYSDACLGNTASFINNSRKAYLDTFKSFFWDFGDSTTSSLENPTHSYVTSGNKTITLIVESALGCIDTLVQNINVKPIITYSADKDSVCLNGNVKFSVQNNGQAITSYRWSFGDGNISSQTSPDYSYSVEGFQYFSVRLTFPDGSTCTNDDDSIRVLPLPDASFTFLTDTVQCFKGNQTCIKFANNSNAISFRNILWDDGSSTPVPVIDTQICHFYASQQGSSYKITHEVIDEFGCAVRLKDSTAIRILKDPQADFTSDISGGCFKSFLTTNNISNMSPPEVVRFIWNFGDGTVDSSNWQNPGHTYTANGNFNVSLFIQDTFGCIDSITGSTAINNISYPVDAALDSVYDYCRLNNRFSFAQTFIPDADITWYFGDLDSSTSFTPFKRYLGVGEYIPTVRISKFGCDSSITLDTVTVYGPFALANITNQYQCQIVDTVFFNNISVPFKNQHLQSYWTLNDPFGGNCTIDTKNGQNVNSNCNRSIDSLSFKHMFTPGSERCFTGYLVQKDTVIGCSDSFFLSVPLMKPNADSGLRIFFQDEACTGPEEPKRVFINLAGTQPNCGREAFYIMWDSLCAAESGNFDSYWRFGEDRHNYGYENMPCDSNGFITMGLILENGLDSFGNTCRDTAFYHDILKLGIIDPRVTSSYDPDSLYCNYTTHEFYFLDSIQDSIVTVRWDFGDGTVRTVNTLGKVYHTYTSPGVYTVSSFMEHARGCNGIDTFQVKIGINNQISPQSIFGCLGDSIRLDNVSTYWQDNNSSFFRDDARTASGKEKTRWDYGLGTGFIDSGYITYLDYARIGNYQVRMEVTDSVGCVDTTGFQFRVFDITSEITVPNDTLVCPQVVQLFSSSTVYDSLNSFGHADDSVSVFIWTFDDGSGSSLQADPSKFFGSGKQELKLYTENTRGCKDSIVDSFYIVGPTANFKLLTDSAGCEPHTVEFDNLSINSNSFSWEFNDQFNNVQNTLDTANLTFTYQTFGTFYPRLISRMNLTNNGIPVSCSDTFPLLENGDSLLPIVVYERPNVTFSHVTDCSNSTTSFTNTTNILTDTILSRLWLFGDGDSSTIDDPIHQYADTGAYRVVLYITVGRGCVDSIVRTIYISPVPQADFTFENVCLGEFMSFEDQTNAFNDVIFRWNWSFGDGAFAGVPTPTHQYGYDTSYDVRLVATNRAGCSDTVTKLVQVHSIPQVSFTFLNACEDLPNKFYGFGSVKNSTMSYKWYFGDGDSTNSKNPVYYYNDTGSYNVDFIVESGFGCRDTATNQVQVYANPIPDFSINDSIQCLNGNQFEFTNNSFALNGDTVVQNYWISSDGGTGFNADYSKVYLSYDSFNIMLINRTNNGCVDTTDKWIQVLESPVLKPSVSNLGICVNADSSQIWDSGVNVNTVLQRSWFLNNERISSDSFFNFKFDSVGSNQISYTKQLANGCIDSANLNVQVHPKPNTFIKVSPREQCFTNNLFSFIDSSYISSNQNLSRKWYLGNGDSSVRPNFNYQYGTSDTFNVTLISTSRNNCQESQTIELIVHPEPIPNFTIDTAELCLRDNRFFFTNNSTVLGSTSTYVWRFDSEDTAITINSDYSFRSDGIKNVKLIATSLFGCQDSIEKTLTVHPMPTSIPTVNAAQQCLNNQNFLFQDSSRIANGNLTRKWLWSNGDTDTSKQVLRSFPKDTQLNHHLISTSSFGCADTNQINVVILPVPEAAFMVNDSAQCVNNQNFSFLNETITKDGPFTSYWSFGEGSLDTVLNAQHIYQSSGPFNVQLIASSSQGCNDTFDRNIYVQEKPNAILTVNDSAQCFKGQDFKFTGNSSITVGSIETFEWDTLNSPFAGTKDTSLLFSQPGTYQIRYSVGSEDLCYDTTYQTITVHPDPIASFTVDDSLQCENDNLFNFTSLSTLPYGSFVDSWYVDVTYFGSGKSPVTQFSNQDTLTINLINTSDKGCRDTIGKELYVVPAPQTSFVINDSGQCLKANQFDFGNNSFIEDGSLTYEWSFGDGNTSQLFNPGHSYVNHGDYLVELISTSIYNCKDTSVVQILVHPEPTAAFLVNDKSQCFTDNSFQFTNNSSVDSTTLAFTWFLGDGNSSNSIDPNHQYNSFGTYSTKLLVSTNYNCLDSMEQTMVVNPMPVTDFTINDSTQCINEQMFVLTNTSQIALGNIQSYEWLTNNQSTFNTSPYQVSYSTSGIYRVKMISTSDSGCLDSLTKILRVYPKPISRITVNDSVQCLRGNNYIYRENSFDSFGLQGFNWVQSNQLVSTADSFQVNYLNSGLKVVDLISNSVNNCKDTTQLEVRVKPMPNPQFNLLKDYYCENEPASPLTPNQQGGIFYGKNVVAQQYIPRALWRDTVKYVITQEGCTDSSSQFTMVYPLPNADLGPDTTICKHESLFIGANSWNSSFVWSTGSSDSAIRITRPGKYSLTASNICGIDTASFNLSIRDINCRFFLPTAFTPNLNAINDNYKPVTFNVDEMTYVIYNRWGEKIFEGNVNDNGWDGTYGGKDAPIGYYVVVVNYSYQTDFRLIQEVASETFYLLR
jgi:gliding motility-associated-like protein